MLNSNKIYCIILIPPFTIQVCSELSFKAGCDIAVVDSLMMQWLAHLVELDGGKKFCCQLPMYLYLGGILYLAPASCNMGVTMVSAPYSQQNQAVDLHV